MRQLKLIIAALFLIPPLAANADIIRVNFTGITVAEVPRRDAVITGDESDLLPYGTGFSGQFVYDTEAKPFFGSCKIFAEADGCEYSAISHATFEVGPFEGRFDHSVYIEDPEELETVQVVDAIPDANSNLDAMNWTYFLNAGANTIDGMYLRAVQVLFQDTTNTAVNGRELPSFWELSDFDTNWVSFQIKGLSDESDFVGIIQTLSITPIPEPGTLALFAIGLAGMGLTRRKKKV